MIRVNLLPLRASRRLESARRQLQAAAGSLVLLVLALLTQRLLATGQLDALRGRVQQTQLEVGELERQVARADDFKAKSALLERKLAAIDRLQKQKLGPARMLSDLADILTRAPKVWLTSLDEKDGILELKGGAMEQSDISHFAMELEKSSHLFRSVSLTLVSSAHERHHAYFQYALRAQIDVGASS